MGRCRCPADRAAAPGGRRRPNAFRLRSLPGHFGPSFRHTHGPLRVGHREGISRRLRRRGETGKPWILFYFRTGKVDLDEIDLDQYFAGPHVPRASRGQRPVRHLCTGAGDGRRVFRASGDAPATNCCPSDAASAGGRASQTRCRRRGRPRHLPRLAGPGVQRGGIAGPAGSTGAGRPTVPGVRAAGDRGRRRRRGPRTAAPGGRGAGVAAADGPRCGAEARTADGPAGRDFVVRRRRRRVGEIHLLPLGCVRGQRRGPPDPGTGTAGRLYRNVSRTAP